MYPKIWALIVMFFIHQPTQFYFCKILGNFKNTISIYFLMCNREFTFHADLMCSAILIISYPKDRIIDLGNFCTQKFANEISVVLDSKIWNVA